MTLKLTGLASRAYFYKHTEDIIRAARRRHERFALLYLDLDGFKDINDSLGHDMGDELLRTVSQRLQSSLRDTDFIARLSGDEFCILVDNVRDQYDCRWLPKPAHKWRRNQPGVFFPSRYQRGQVTTSG